MLASILVICSCAKEDKIIPTAQTEAGKFEFPENTKYDDITLSIYEKTGVQILWTKVRTIDINRDWATNELSSPKKSRIPSDEQAGESINFLNDYIFNKLDVQFFNKVMKPYIYIVEDLYKPVSAASLRPINFDLLGMDCWVFSFFGEGEAKYPMYKSDTCIMPRTDAEIFKYRRRIFFTLFEEMVKKGYIATLPEFGTDFDYATQTKYNATDAEDPNFTMNRGFCGTVNVTKGQISAITSRPKDLTNNFLSYVCLVATFSREEMTNGTAYPIYTNNTIIPYKGYSKVLKYYDLVYNYILDEYGYDLTQLHSLK